VEAALAFLDRHGVPGGKLSILDIGCGPGSFALAFARRGHNVTALDHAGKMLEMLREKLAAEQGLPGAVQTVLADWTELDLDDRGWRGRFDLVFASMTPGIRDVATLEKAMAASRCFVYLSRFAGPRIMPSLEAAWEELRGGTYHSPSLDIIYPFNWLYASGFRPVIGYNRWEREHRQTAEEALEELLDILSMRMPVDNVSEQKVRELVISRSDQGLVVERKGATAAMLLWRVDGELL
jgi:SAM-dependent methyltransferase